MKFYDSKGNIHNSLLKAYYSDLKALVSRKMSSVMETTVEPELDSPTVEEKQPEKVDYIEEGIKIIDDYQKETGKSIFDYPDKYPTPEPAIVSEDAFLEKVLYGVKFDLERILMTNEDSDIIHMMLDGEQSPNICKMVDTITSLSSGTIEKAYGIYKHMMTSGDPKLIEKILSGVMDVVKKG